MRLRDRRALIAAIILLAAYAGMLVATVLWMLQAAAGIPVPPTPPAIALLLLANGAFLVWRLAVRALFVHRAYGFAEAARSVPRTVLANIIAMMAARRAVSLYLRLWRGGTLRWDKTDHRFPDLASSPPP
jgi:bacteriophage N4 adsorption protein B